MDSSYIPPKLIPIPEMFCVKCRMKVKPKSVETMILKNGKLALRGMCPVCGTSMFKIGIEQELEKEPPLNKRDALMRKYLII